jgi:hypothetical protein
VTLCVAGQTTMTPLFRSVLVVGEQKGAWTSGSPLGPTYSALLQSSMHARCGNNTVGHIYELCAACPEGASCPDGGLGGPQSQASFFATTPSRAPSLQKPNSRASSTRRWCRSTPTW